MPLPHPPPPLPRHDRAQTLLDYASVAPLNRVRRALAEAEYRRVLNLDEVEQVLGQGRPGSARLRAAPEHHRPQLAQTRSVLEERFLALCEEAAFPLPEVNARVEGLMVDFLWREQRVVVSSTVKPRTPPLRSASVTMPET